MTVSNSIDKLIEFFSWLYFRPWERWELLIIVLICLVLLLLIIWQQRKSSTKSVYVNHVRERSPIIGVKLADNRNHLQIEDLKQDRSDPVPKKRTKQRKTKERFATLNEQVQQLQNEISKHKQTEASLKHQVTELTTVNEQLQENTAVNKQVEQKPKQQIIEVPTVNEQPPNEPAESSTVKQEAKLQTGESKAAKKSSKRRINIRKQPDRPIREKTEQIKLSKEHRDQPLDIEKLKAMADLAKKIKGLSRPK